MYIRLLTYDQAMEVITYLRSIGGQAFITVGGVGLESTPEQVEQAIKYMNEKGWTYETTIEHPQIIKDRLIENLRNAGQIE